MKILCFSVEVTSFLAGDIWSDQIWGHVAWAIKATRGDDVFQEFIDSYKNATHENDLPMIFSSLFPKGYLPLPEINYNVQELFRDEEGYKKVKKIKKARFVDDAYFSELSKSLTPEANVLELFKHIRKEKDEERDFMHNTIDRKSGRVLDRALFVQEQKTYKKPLWLFVKVSEKWVELLKEALKFIEIRGLGADAATGAGQVVIKEEFPDCMKEWDKEKNCFISLSHAVSSKAKYYKTVTKYGKLFQKTDGSDNPFKQPVILMEPGALLEYGAKKTIAESVIRNVHRNDVIIHFAIPFLVPVNCVEVEQ